MLILAISFPYHRDTVKNGHIFRPKIPIRLVSEGRHIDIVGLVDSGSDTSFITRDVAEYLGLNLNRKKGESRGIGGKIETITTQVGLQIVSKDGLKIVGRIDVEVPIKPDPNDIIIIGRLPFFLYYDITFRENAKRVILQRHRR